MTRDEAMQEVKRRRAASPEVSWIATQRAGEWVIARIGVAPTKPTGTATKPEPPAPHADPSTPLQRAAWTAGLGWTRRT